MTDPVKLVESLIPVEVAPGAKYAECLPQVFVVIIKSAIRLVGEVPHNFVTILVERHREEHLISTDCQAGTRELLRLCHRRPRLFRKYRMDEVSQCVGGRPRSVVRASRRGSHA